ncbi:cysteine hydrolase family protein [Priestia filamentosa]|uniref:Isochorismatase n=1 Tax=Priestia filamentosa TaxID=1402861 RepID=A0A1X7GXX6_9BACI|nr:isochorismatase family cysteine hydrolase [Priestia filamentosa]AKO90703.1 isochorismatase [Priestia filamentosa]MDT3766423.1 isochorismatase family cysteine hydrolase [Priestia filamentosa]OXS64650.1 isochorismatase [Priestia filamentosa]RJS65951.1 cysteine hydrolase [Priestia filamentosa]WCM15846.1 cysteine hydrolase [Priestia filamentosa]
MNELKNPALIIIDMINDFQFELGQELAQQAQTIVPYITMLKEICYKKEIPVIYINDHYNLWQANLDVILKNCHNKRSSQILQKIKPKEDDFFLIKPKHSIFYGTALNVLLEELSVESLILTGIAGNICVLFSANDAYMRKYPLFIPSDCIASNVEEDNIFALRMMKNVLGASTDCHQSLIELLSSIHPSYNRLK